MNTNHTPFPFLHIETNHTLYECVVLGPEENGASSIYFQGDLESGEEIVRRCNSFPALLAALEGLYEALKGRVHSQPALVALGTARAVIAQAVGRGGELGETR